LQLSELLDVGKLGRIDRAILVLREDQNVDHTDCSGVCQGNQLRSHLAREVARTRRKLHDELVDGSEFVERCISHQLAPSRADRLDSHKVPGRAIHG